METHLQKSKKSILLLLSFILTFAALGTKLYAQVAANVTVGPGGTYTSFTNAGGLFAAINSSGMNQNVTATVIGNITETGANNLNEFASPRTLTIRPNSATERVITITAQDTLFVFRGTDRVTIDGSFNGSGRFLRFVANNATRANTQSLFFLYDGVSNLEFKNCIFESNTQNNNNGIFLIGGPSSTQANENITIQGNIFRGVTGSFFVNALRSTGFNANRPKNLNIVNNDFTGFSFAGSAGSSPVILIEALENSRIDSNRFYAPDTATAFTQGVDIIDIDQNSARYSSKVSINYNSFGGFNANRSGAFFYIKTPSFNVPFTMVRVRFDSLPGNEVRGNRVGNIGANNRPEYRNGVNFLSSNGSVDVYENIIGGKQNAWDTLTNGYDNGWITVNSNNYANPDTIRVYNNLISDSRYNKGRNDRHVGIYVLISTGNKHVRVYNNTIKNFFGNSSINQSGFCLAGIRITSNITSTASVKVYNNVISNLQSNKDNTSNLTDVGQLTVGIIAGSYPNAAYYNNRIFNLGTRSDRALDTGANVPSIVGMLITSADPNLRVYNNQISLSSNSRSICQGISVTTGAFSSPKIYNNSIYIAGNAPSSLPSERSACIAHNSSSGIKVFNNILYSNRGFTAPSYAYDIRNNTNLGDSSFQNNLFITPTSSIAYWPEAGNNNQTLTSWRALRRFDTTSQTYHISQWPVASLFTHADTANLSILTAAHSIVLGRGIAVDGVDEDVNGTARPDPPSLGAYEYGIPGPPVISSLLPTTGKPGDILTINGSGFNSTSANNTVFIGGVKATIISASGSQIRVIVPIGASTNKVLVTNTGTGLSGESKTSFISTYSPAFAELSNCNFPTSLIKSVPAGSPRRVALGDLDGDGKLDMVVTATSPASISIYRNVSNSTTLDTNSFSAPFTLQTGLVPTDVEIKDLDRDGKADIIVIAYASNQVNIFKNQYTSGAMDSASFAPRLNIFVPSGPYYLKVVDIDNDGKLDIAAGRANGTLAVLKNNSSVGVLNSSSFASLVSFPIAPNPIDMDFADFNDDGKMDLVLTSYDSAIVSVLINTSTNGTINSSSFAPVLRIPVARTTGQGLKAADFDNDGKVDFAVAFYTNGSGVQVFKNQYSSGIFTTNSFVASPVFSAGSTLIGALAAADVSGDGKIDLITGSATGINNFFILTNKTTTGVIDSASFSTVASAKSTISSAVLGAVVADINGDSIPEIIGALNTNRSIAIARITPSSTTLSLIGTLNPFSACTGYASDTQSVMVIGSNLQANVSVVAPSGFQISTNGTTGFTTNLNLIPSNGSLNTRLYIRLNGSMASGSPSGNLTFTSTCLTTQTLALSGTVNAIPSITLGSIPSVGSNATSFSIPYTATSGNPDKFTISSVAPTPMPNFTAVTDANLTSSPISVNKPTNITANTYTFQISVKNSSAGCSSIDYPFSLSVTAPLMTAPVVATGAISAITTNSATMGGNVSDSGTATVTERGIVYATTANPTTANNKVIIGSGIGSFSQNITGLTASTTYHVRAYAINSAGTSYGGDSTFTTAAIPPSLPPTVITAGILNITSNSADLYGQVTDSGTATVTERGFVYALTANPTIANGFKLVKGAGLGTYFEQALGLTPLTTYYYRAYAINSVDTAYGADSAFTTLDNPKPLINVSGTLTAFSTCVGAPSNEQTFLISGINLLDDVIITAPAGFELTRSSGVDFAQSIRLPMGFGNVPLTTVYIRLNSNISGNFGGNIRFVSDGADTVFLAAAGIVNPSPDAPVISIKPATPICVGTEYLNFGASNAPGTGVTYQWGANNADLYATGSTKQHALVSFPQSGSATVTLTATNAQGCIAQTEVTVDVKPEQTHTATVRYFNNNFVCQANLVTNYQWGYDDVPTLKGNTINGEINQNYFNPAPDLSNKAYWVISTKGNCYQKSYYNTPTGMLAITNNVGNIQVYPNPFESVITVGSTNGLLGASIEVTDLHGKTISTWQANDEAITLDLTNLSAGVYLVKVIHQGKINTSKIVKQ